MNINLSVFLIKVLCVGGSLQHNTILQRRWTIILHDCIRPTYIYTLLYLFLYLLLIFILYEGFNKHVGLNWDELFTNVVDINDCWVSFTILHVLKHAMDLFVAYLLN